MDVYLHGFGQLHVFDPSIITCNSMSSIHSSSVKRGGIRTFLKTGIRNASNNEDEKINDKFHDVHRMIGLFKSIAMMYEKLFSSVTYRHGETAIGNIINYLIKINLKRIINCLALNMINIEDF